MLYYLKKATLGNYPVRYGYKFFLYSLGVACEAFMPISWEVLKAPPTDHIFR